MGYYIRLLGTKDPNIHLDELLQALEKKALSAKLSIPENETPDNWSILEVANENGDILTQIGRNPIIEGELGKEELEEFRKEIQECKPTTAVQWLTKYFDNIQVIYAFQLLDNAFEDNNFSIISTIKEKMWNNTGGIFQADGEGFSNEDGYHILWQFSDTVTGDWHCAVLNNKGKWERFLMDLGNKQQRQDFWAGKVPSSTT